MGQESTTRSATETTTETVARPVRTPRVGIHRFKPRASARTQFILAATLWTFAATALGIRGAGWLFDSEYAWALLATSALLAALKYRYILSPTALRAIDRIDRRGDAQCAGGFFSWQSWVLVIVMMAGGHALRLTAAPRPLLGTLYVTIALALAAGAVRFARAASSPRC